ncbi:siphovirus Gp157 family protein (plasmid) [Skermanella rosea]|uniref:siphovirus Gp157 family protein n=1 Tax=Skermanella rosea TaxID=1817965 RepID=UPI00193382C4|nr:siphovirus Gp157 family protein [Skermanella rosea]UEM08095.1 siphovirus Gp157 family protein [Skermanella rosea]
MSYLQKEAIAVAKLKQVITEAGHDDPELIAGMIEGSTEFREIIGTLFDRLAEAEDMTAALAERSKAIQARKKRYEGRIEAIRNIIFEGLVLADERKVELPEATCALTAARQSVVITDEAALPDDCVKIERKPDHTTIKAKLDAGQAVPGATLSNGGQTLTIRRN